MASEQRRRTAYDKVQSLLAKADMKEHYGRDEAAERLRQQAFAIERDYGGFDDIRAEQQRTRQRQRDRADDLDCLFALVMDADVRAKHPRVRAWASAAIDEIKEGGPLLRRQR